MFSDVTLVVRTGAPGSGKTYWCVKEIYDFYLEYYGKDMKIVTNLPLTHQDARIEVREFTDDVMSNPTFEEFHDCVLVLDECQRWITKKNRDAWIKFVGEARHYNVRLQLLSQSKDNFPDGFNDLIGIWYESNAGGTLRDKHLGVIMDDWAQIWAKLTGRYYQFFEITEYKKVERFWKSQTSRTEWFDPRIGKLYNSHNRSHGDTAARGREYEYQKFGWVKLLRMVWFRNPWCVWNAIRVGSVTVFPFGLGLAGLALTGAMFSSSSSTAVPVAKSEPMRQVVPFDLQKELEAKSRGIVLPDVKEVSVKVEKAESPKAKKVVKAATRWVWLLLLLNQMGCVMFRSPFEIPMGAGMSHVVRSERAYRGDPKIGIAGPGHDLDAVAEQAGLKVRPRGLTVDGPGVGRDVVDKARRIHGLDFEAGGSRLVPGRAHWVPVPDEFGEEEIAAETRVVGGRRVAKVRQVDRDQWHDMSDVRHECYAVEFLVASVNASDSKSLSVGFGGSGGVTVAYPRVVNPFAATSKVTFGVDGQWITGRQLARPIVRSPHGEAATLHVGGKFPFRLSSSTASAGGVQQTIGSTVQTVSTGTQVQVTVERISLSQVLLQGQVKISSISGTNDGMPITTERSVALGQIMDLDSWQLCARLDSVNNNKSGAWLGLGGLVSWDEQCFVVLCRVVQDVVTQAVEVADTATSQPSSPLFEDSDLEPIAIPDGEHVESPGTPEPYESPASLSHGFKALKSGFGVGPKKAE